MIYECKADWEEFKKEFVEAAIVNNENVTMKERTCWLPRKCYISGKSLFRKRALRAVRIVPMTSARIKEVYWLDPREYTLFLLRCGK